MGFDCLQRYCDAQRQDGICSYLYISSQSARMAGPRKEQMPQSMLPHWHVRGELTLCNDLLLRREAL